MPAPDGTLFVLAGGRRHKIDYTGAPPTDDELRRAFGNDVKREPAPLSPANQTRGGYLPLGAAQKVQRAPQEAAYVRPAHTPVKPALRVSPSRLSKIPGRKIDPNDYGAQIEAQRDRERGYKPNAAQAAVDDAKRRFARADNPPAGVIYLDDGPPKPAQGARDWFTRVLPESAERALTGIVNLPVTLPQQIIGGLGGAMDRMTGAREIAPYDPRLAAEQRQKAGRQAVGTAASLLPFGGEATTAIFDGPRAALEQLGGRAINDPASVALDTLGAYGMAKGIGAARAGRVTAPRVSAGEAPPAPSGTGVRRLASAEVQPGVFRAVNPEPLTEAPSVPAPIPEAPVTRYDPATRRFVTDQPPADGLPAAPRNRVSSRVVPAVKKVGAGALDAANAPRSLMASGDWSAPFRQALVATVSHPGEAVKAAGSMFRAGARAEVAEAQAAQRAARPNAPLYEQTGLQVDGAGSEMFRSRLAESIPGVGRLVKASDRAFGDFLVELRSNVFDHNLEVLSRDGRTPQSHPEVYHAMADWVNVSTGTVADLGRLKALEPVLQQALFAPKFQASRLQLMNPAYYAKMPAPVRRMALADMGKTVGVGVGLMALAKMGGAEVGDDPRRSDWGTIIVKGEEGETRIDIWGGMRPWARLLALAAVDPGAVPAAALKRGEGVLAPGPSLALDAFRGSTYSGQPFNGPDAITQRSVPLLWQDAVAAMQGQGSAKGAALAAPSAFGVGVSTYPKSPPRDGAVNRWRVTGPSR